MRNWIFNRYVSQSVKRGDLMKPDPLALATVLETGLKQIFAHARVEWGPCPDLTQEPFYLTAQGLGGRTSIIDVGGTSISQPKLCNTYDVEGILNVIGRYYPTSFIFGDTIAKDDQETLYDFFVNMKFVRETDLLSHITNRSCTLKLLPTNKNCILTYENRFECFGRGTFFLCNGSDEPVLKVYAANFKNLFSNDINITNPTLFTDTIQAILTMKVQDNRNNAMVLGGVYKTNHVDTWSHQIIRNDREKSLFYNNHCCIVKMPVTRMAIIHNSYSKYILPLWGPPMRLNDSKFTRCLGHHISAEHHCQYYNTQFVEYEGYFRVVDEIFRVNEANMEFLPLTSNLNKYVVR